MAQPQQPQRRTMPAKFKLRRATQNDWGVSTFVEDGHRARLDPPKEDGDGNTYVVRDIFGQFISQRLSGGWVAMCTDKKRAYPFYDNQAAWGAASRSIYPAEVLLVVEQK
jgi:hypothetical protein